MKSPETLLRNGNKRNAGRQTPNKDYRKEILLIGRENCLSLYQMQLDMAANSPSEDIRRSSQQFLLDKVLPKALPARYIRISLPTMHSMEDIQECERIIMKNVCDGSISLEEGDRLFAMTEQSRKAYVATELSAMIEEMDKRMKDKGI